MSEVTLAGHIRRIRELEAEVERLRQRNAELDKGCLYCTFGEDAPFTADDLKRHIESECDFHPLRKMKADFAPFVAVAKAVDETVKFIEHCLTHPPQIYVRDMRSVQTGLTNALAHPAVKARLKEEL